jgi:hypothetical protein
MAGPAGDPASGASVEVPLPKVVIATRRSDSLTSGGDWRPTPQPLPFDTTVGRIRSHGRDLSSLAFRSP